MLGHQRLELGHELAVSALGQVGVDGLLERAETKLPEASDLGRGERLVGDVVQRASAPKAERLACGAALDKADEAQDVDVVRRNPQLVAAPAREDGRRRAVA